MKFLRMPLPEVGKDTFLVILDPKKGNLIFSYLKALKKSREIDTFNMFVTISLLSRSKVFE